MLQINGKTFMNLQEAVQWLLDNNALPFQSSANYVANTEIGMGTIVNPSPAKVRIGSLIFFADSKVSTVVGLTENGFIVSDQYNDLVDDVVYVSNVALNASGHLIVTLSNGDNIDAGLIKQVTGFSIDGSQHLIVSYNDGTSTDLGAIFSGNVTISGNLTVTGAISGSAISGGSVSGTAITGDSIIENMTGYSFIQNNPDKWNADYVGCVKNGNKLTLVLFGSYERLAGHDNNFYFGSFILPNAIRNKLYPYTLGGLTTTLDCKVIPFYNSVDAFTNIKLLVQKETYITFQFRGLNTLTDNTTYYFRAEVTFLLSDSLAS